MGKLSSLCDVCGVAPALLSCMFCGARVCKKCFKDGACTRCICGKRQPPFTQ